MLTCRQRQGGWFDLVWFGSIDFIFGAVFALLDAQKKKDTLLAYFGVRMALVRKVFLQKENTHTHWYVQKKVLQRGLPCARFGVGRSC